jgi:hypothetical protein
MGAVSLWEATAARCPLSRARPDWSALADSITGFRDPAASAVTGWYQRLTRSANDKWG